MGDQIITRMQWSVAELKVCTVPKCLHISFSASLSLLSSYSFPFSYFHELLSLSQLSNFVNSSPVLLLFLHQSCASSFSLFLLSSPLFLSFLSSSSLSFFFSSYLLHL